MKQPAPRIIVKYEYGSPLDLLDLTGSLAAFGEQFRRFAGNDPVFAKGSNPRLHVAAIKEGSIVAELAPWVQQLDWLLEHREAAVAFVSQWQEILNLLVRGDQKAKALDKPTLRAAVAFVEPVAKDNAAQLNIAANEGSTVLFAGTVNYFEANAAQSNARRFLIDDFPADAWFENEPMILYQIRDAHPGKSGDMGIMDRFGTRPIKLTWGSETAKDSVLTHPDNPFALVFWVAGKAQTVGGRVVGLHIVAMNSTSHRDDDSQ